jgi:hypothetical protein
VLASIERISRRSWMHRPTIGVHDRFRWPCVVPKLPRCQCSDSSLACWRRCLPQAAEDRCPVPVTYRKGGRPALRRPFWFRASIEIASAS